MSEISPKNITVKQETENNDTSTPTEFVLSADLSSMLSNLQSLLPSTTHDHSNSNSNSNDQHASSIEHETENQPNNNNNNNNTNGTSIPNDSTDEQIQSIIPTDKYSTVLKSYIQWFRGTIDEYTVVCSSGTYAATTTCTVQLPSGHKLNDHNDTSSISTVSTGEVCQLLSIELLGKLFVGATQKNNTEKQLYYDELYTLADKKDLTYTTVQTDHKPIVGHKRTYNDTVDSEDSTQLHVSSVIWKSQSSGPYVLHIKNIPNDTTEQDIINYFLFCELSRIWLNNNTHEVYIEFMNIAHALTGYQYKYTKPILKPGTDRFSMFDVVKTAVPYVEPYMKTQLDSIQHGVNLHNQMYRSSSDNSSNTKPAVPSTSYNPPAIQSSYVSQPTDTPYKHGICKQYITRGTCNYGNHCKYAHALDELSPDRRRMPDADLLKKSSAAQHNNIPSTSSLPYQSTYITPANSVPQSQPYRNIQQVPQQSSYQPSNPYPAYTAPSNPQPHQSQQYSHTPVDPRYAPSVPYQQYQTHR